MDFCRNVSSCEYHHQNPEQVLGSLDDLFSAQNMEVDMSLEWLSVFVEDCFSSAGSCLQLSTSLTPTTNIDTKPRSSAHEGENPQTGSGYKQKFVIPVKARSKRQRLTGTKTKSALATGWAVTDPPLLQQTLWLADSELINPKEVNSSSGEQTRIYTVQNNSERKIGLKSEVIESGEERVIGIRKCSHCQAQKTPQWRAGPMGPKTLCNACGVRYKSGRLFPEYRPAKSPTFVSYLHSNSHKKVLEMRHATLNGS